MLVTFTKPWGEELTFDPHSAIQKCIKIYAKHGLNHASCKHCPDLKSEVEHQIDVNVLLTALEPVSKTDEAVAEAMEFAEWEKPWGTPLAPPNDTQPYLEVNVDASGFEIVE
jgi:hypothetical protein